ncbi:MAG: hypothetical protein DLM71_05765 [Chloroflexi bacterium]|nr:MAG: hypothetical protein DLM71_05765 [Chloroflexota bacterium]
MWIASLAGLLAAGCGAQTIPAAGRISAPPILAGREPAATPATPLSMVALGDSIVAYPACGCESYPQIYGRLAARALGRPVTVRNLGIGGTTSADLLQSVRSDSAVRAALRGADIVTITIGINDIGSCEAGADLECYGAASGALGPNVEAILAEIGGLEASHRYILRETDYYNHVIGKADRAELGPSYQLLFAQQLTTVNSAICAAVTAHHGRCVDLLTAFNGPAANQDAAPFLLPDHVHPSAEGNRIIAAQIAAAGYLPLQ